MQIHVPEDFVPPRFRNQTVDGPDWHAGVLRLIANQLGVGHDAYFPLHGAANKLEMFRQGRSYDEAIEKEGGAPERASEWQE